MARVSSAEAGWSLDVPESWYVQPTTRSATDEFGAALLTSYDTTRLGFGGTIGMNMLPASTGVELRVEIWSNSQREALDAVAPVVARQLSVGDVRVSDGRSVNLNGVAAYRATVTEMWRPDPVIAPPAAAVMQRDLWLVPSSESGRLVVLDAWPLTNPFISAVERAVSTLTISVPVHARAPVLRTRAEIVHDWLYDATGSRIPGRRAEAKLVTWAQANALVDNWTQPALGRIDRSPDELFWLVAVSGPELPATELKGDTVGSIVYETPATVGDGGPLSRRLGASIEWPRDFDRLPDLCREGK